MRYVLWAKGARGVACLKGLCAAGRRPTLVVLEPCPIEEGDPCALAARGLGLPTILPDELEDAHTLDRLRREQADLFVLAGYGRILPRAVLDLPARMTINAHAGALPEYRGSSPLNWALIHGDSAFSLSIVEVDEGVDTGPVLLERAHPIGPDDTIVDLHRVANRAFPELLLEAIDRIEAGTVSRREQDPAAARYFPRRFPDDGLILFDRLTAAQVHNRVRALRPPYPGAFTYWHGRKVILASSELRGQAHFGEPGRIYRTSDGGLLVCASDCCLWIRESWLADDGTPLASAAQRYDRLATAHEAVQRLLESSPHEGDAARRCATLGQGAAAC